MKFGKIIGLMPLLSLPLCMLPSSLTSCSKNDEVYDALTKLDNVVQVDKVKVDYTNRKVYDIWFEQPIDWNDLSIGTFKQRFRFSFAGFDAVNELFIWGYELNQLLPVRYTDFEEAERYNGNTLRMEYRFYGLSCPDGLSNYNLKYWDYLTVENAAKDFHRIITSFKKVFIGKWIFAGGSKGGFTTNVQAMLYPQDADVFISYVAPKANGIKEESMYEYTFAAGQGKDALKPHRLNLAKYLLYALKNKNEIIDKYFDPYIQETIQTENSHYTEYFLANMAKSYEACLGEFAVQFWQFEEDVEQLKAFNDLPDNEDKKKACFDLLCDLSSPTTFDINYRNDFAYYSQAYREMGEHKLAFDYMINFINTELGASSVSRSDFSTDKDDEDMLWWKLLLLPFQITTWTYDGTIKSQLEQWYTTSNQANVIMVYGSCDPWTAMSLSEWSPNTKCDNIHVYYGYDDNNPHARSHRARIVELSNEQQNEIWGLMDSWLA